jgi:hypothetical protein
MAEQFVINDRRGQKKEPRQDIQIVQAQLEENTDKSSWKEVCFPMLLMNVQTGQGQPPQTIVMGRAAGERSDGRVFIADYALPQVWEAGFDWTKYAQKRLDTFLGCDCKETVPCATHKMYLPQWQQQDMQRLSAIAQAPVPRPLEILMMAEQARRSNLIVPGRG